MTTPSMTDLKTAVETYINDMTDANLDSVEAIADLVATVGFSELVRDLTRHLRGFHGSGMTSWDTVSDLQDLINRSLPGNRLRIRGYRRATYSAARYELFSGKGRGKAAKAINRFMDEGFIQFQDALYAVKSMTGRQAREAALGIARSINDGVESQIQRALYHRTYGALDTEPRFIITNHIIKSIRSMTNVDLDGAF